jgi:hypothetical protein
MSPSNRAPRQPSSDHPGRAALAYIFFVTTFWAGVIFSAIIAPAPRRQYVAQCWALTLVIGVFPLRERRPLSLVVRIALGLIPVVLAILQLALAMGYFHDGSRTSDSLLWTSVAVFVYMVMTLFAWLITKLFFRL